MADFLEQIAQFRDNVAIICEDKTYTYATLLQEIQNKKQTLHSIPQGSVVAILGDYSPLYFAYFFALYSKKCIICPLLTKNIDFDLSEFGIEFILDKTQIQTLNSKKYALLEKLKTDKSSGLILFSSGSTGKPKAIVHNLESFLKFYCDKKYNPLRILSVYLPDHIAGIDVMLNALAGGGTLIIPKQRQPQYILSALEQHKIEILPASPTLLRLLLLSEYKKYALDALKLVIYGSEAMSETLLESLQQALPHVKFKQSFGTSETSAIKTKSHPSKKGFFKILNPYKIINNELYLKSKTQTLGYLNADNSAFDNEGYFATGDLVEIMQSDGEEYLKILGRSKEMINVGGEKVLPQEVENVILEIPCVKDCLVYGESSAIMGQSVSVKVVLDTKIALSNLELKKQIRSFCKDKLATFKIPTKVEIVESLAMSKRFKKLRNIIGGGG
ncbi:ANL family adenylate-forming protein [Helicobacter turcicus]|uniref:Long-chain fatty acid--CoA ligase n=2 Tax=Helicobacter turcicus TaxID=2867412 RepID=A0ABS7JQ87_9HELI|nr:fatty acid--CoA ligase family protein [Helicobacter turcicus]MBX7491517.1 long-chain fatty acid--CoA ligase [Helicobacter turcicus]